MSCTVIGTPVPRVEGVEKVTGAGRYAASVFLPGTLWGKASRSPLPHARIVGIDSSRARQLNGEHAVLTAADLPDMRTGRRLHDVTVLARDRVRHIGEKVAVVAADDPDVAEAARSDPGRLRRAACRLRSAASHAAHEPHPAPRAPHIFEDAFTTPMQHHGHLEPHSCVVRAGETGHVDVWSAGKQPFNMRSWIADAGTGKSGAIISVDESGRVELVVGVPEVGSGAHTMMRQLVAEILQVAPTDVSVELAHV